MRLLLVLLVFALLVEDAYTKKGRKKGKGKGKHANCQGQGGNGGDLTSGRCCKPFRNPCHDLEDPINGTVATTLYAIFSCNQGFMLSGGPREVLCSEENCRWEALIPTCVPTTGGAGGSGGGGGAGSGSRLTGSCDPNPCLNGGSCIQSGMFYHCNCTEKFDGPNCGYYLGPYGQCKEVRSPCLIPDPPENGYLDLEIRARFSCRFGQLSGPRQIICDQKSCMWPRAPPKCVQV